MIDRLATLGRNITAGLNPRFGIGSNVFDEEWDLLIILDSPRADAFAQIENEYPQIRTESPKLSVGGTSPEWIVNTFTKDAVPRNESVGVVTQNPLYQVLDGNVQSGGVNALRDAKRIEKWGVKNTISIDEFDTFVDISTEVRTLDGGDAQYSPPEVLTNHAIHLGRHANIDRLVLHYMQPHRPYIGAAVKEERPAREHETAPWGYIQQTGDKNEVWDAYIETTHWVLEEVERLLENTDGKALITADHGEALGEYTAYGHHAGSFHPRIRRVPWAWAAGEDSGQETVSLEELEDVTETVSRDDQLEALGYK